MSPRATAARVIAPAAASFGPGARGRLIDSLHLGAGVGANLAQRNGVDANLGSVVAAFAFPAPRTSSLLPASPALRAAVGGAATGCAGTPYPWTVTTPLAARSSPVPG